MPTQRPFLARRRRAFEVKIQARHFDLDETEVAKWSAIDQEMGRSHQG